MPGSPLPSGFASVGAANTFTAAGQRIGGNASSGVLLYLNGAAGQTRDVRFQSAGVDRFALRLSGDAESGGNAGSLFQIVARNDDGTLKGTPVSIDRSSMTVTLSNSTIISLDTTSTAVISHPGLYILDEYNQSGSAGSADLLIERQETAVGGGGQYFIRCITGGAGGSGNAPKFLVDRTGAPGFYGTTPPAKPAVTGSRGSNAALQSLLTALASFGLITDSTT